jgi:L-asparaginase
MEKPSIHFILTGGTIDSYYDGTKDTAIPNERSIIPKYINSLKLYNHIEFSEICMKDSREITSADRNKMLFEIESSKHKCIIVTHGTYTMPDSARFIEANIQRKDQTILFTAAMLPMMEFTMSDGPFNLGFSVAKVQDMPNGVYVSINGTLFKPKDVVKLISEGRFDSIIGENNRSNNFDK